MLDCDYPCDSGSAIIYTTEERARDMRQKPVFVESYALSAITDLNFEILEDMAVTAPKHCADQLWARTDLGPKDVDCAQLYDGFTFITFQWLEALGFCEPGGAGPFVSAGHTRLGGSLPDQHRRGRLQRRPPPWSELLHRSNPAAPRAVRSAPGPERSDRSLVERGRALRRGHDPHIGVKRGPRAVAGWTGSVRRAR